jgi:hypothetical protein
VRITSPRDTNSLPVHFPNKKFNEIQTSTGKSTAPGQVPKVKSLVLSMYSLYRRPGLTSQFLKESRSIT